MAEHALSKHHSESKHDLQKSFFAMNKITEYSVLWLDDQQNDPLNFYQISRSKLRGIIDYLQYFTATNVCVADIQRKKDQAIFVIVISSCCLPLLDQIHALSQVHSIYVYQENTRDRPAHDVSYCDVPHVYEKVGHTQYSFVASYSCRNRYMCCEHV